MSTKMIEVPLVINPSNADCGPASLMMALLYFGKSAKLEAVINRSRSEDCGLSWTIGLAKAAAEYGLKVDFYSLSIDFNPELFKHPYYQLHTVSPKRAQEDIKRLIKKARKLGVNLIKNSVTNRYIFSRISSKSIPIVLLNWNLILGLQGFHGHYVPVVGYKDGKVVVHDSGPENPKKNYTINEDLFEAARKSDRTDEDVLFLSL